jgi:hypothetical protein
VVWALPRSLAATWGISLISFPRGTEMVQFPRYGFAYLCIQYAIRESLPVGYPIRLSRDRRICAPPPGFSQLIAAFFAVWLLGIHHEPVFTWPYYGPFSRRLPPAPTIEFRPLGTDVLRTRPSASVAAERAFRELSLAPSFPSLFPSVKDHALRPAFRARAGRRGRKIGPVAQDGAGPE